MKTRTELKIKTVDKDSKIYPKQLLDLKDPPAKLYYIGNLESINFEKALAMVGSRRMTHYGKQVIDKFVPDFVSSGVVIVSGFMYGVDTEAHRKCVEYGGKTVAVTACGLDICYPPENEKLFKQIIESGGVVLSEHPSGVKPQLWTFPRRNRIVASLSTLGTLVIEAAQESGSLITAKLARQLKRNVYAVPGPITSSVSFGTNYMIQNEKAKMTVRSSDIFPIDETVYPNENPQKLVGLEAKIYQTLLRENCTLDELSIMLGEEVSIVSSQISLMSLKGLVEEIGGKIIAKQRQK